MSYNIFSQAHLPLKTALLSGCITLSSNGGDLSFATECIGKVEEVLEVFEEQIKLEASKILPFIFEYEPSIWNTYTSDHHKANNLARDLEALVRSFNNAKEDKERSAILQKIKAAFNQFVLFNFHHMDDEEPVLNEILWRYYPDTFIMQIAADSDPYSPVKYQEQKGAMQMAKAA